MTSDRPTSGERLNHGDATTPRQSASVILLRDGTDGLELLLVRRNPAQRFMGGYWVFPGGAVDAAEGEGDRAHRAAAVRELREEAGVDGIDVDELVKYSRWITPELIETRFDTHFFVVRAPAGTRPRADGVECVDLRWSTPRAALDAHASGRLALVFPTRRHLEELASFGSVDELLEHARARDVQPVRPRIVLDGERAEVFLPGEPGYAGT
jgi:8-oxo-dGTP pyrophosphatase MutT (NUDIX family)